MVAAASALTLLAQAEHEVHGGDHINPYITGISAFVFLVLCLAVTLSFNRDR